MLSVLLILLICVLKTRELVELADRGNLEPAVQ
jgi:hypothetical protein